MLLLRLWPIRPHPLPDELLSSWVLRLALANGWRLREFYRRWVGSASRYFAMDVDVRAPPELVEVLVANTGRSDQAIAELTLKELEGTVFEVLGAQRHTDWVLARCAPGAGPGQRAGLQFCPDCLAEDQQIYYRRTWRLAWATSCVRHARWLEDRCGSCAAPVQPGRVTVGVRSAHRLARGAAGCGSCGEDLRRAPSTEPVPDELLRLQAQCEQALQDGYVDFAGNSNLHALAFFSGLRHVASGLWRHEFAQRPRAGRHERVRLEWASQRDRRVVMARTAKAMQSWPHGFLAAVREMPAPYSHFTREARPRPAWFDRVYSELGRRGAPIAPGELAALKDIVKREEGVFTASAAQRLYGRNLFFPTRHEPRPTVDPDDVELLIAGLDHRISVTAPPQRAELLRDKMMFLAAHVLSLRLSDLARAQVQSPWIEPTQMQPPLIGWTLPSDAQSLQPWLWWYLAKVRPLFRGAANCDALFLARTTGRAMSAGLMSMRFNRAVHDAGLSRRMNFRLWIRASCRSETVRDAPQS